jgi:hypothetical protein
MRIFLVAACLPILLSAQTTHEWEISANPPNPKVRETVVVELKDLSSNTPGLKIDWDSEGGEVTWSVKSGTQGKFTAAKPGQVTIICYLSGGLKNEIRKELEITGDTPPGQESSQTASSGAKAPQRAAPPMQPALLQPSPPHSSEPLPSDAKPIEALVDPSVAQVVATGWMGDALARNVVSLVGGQNCKFDVGCLALMYDIPNRKEGFVAFAWQVVPQGQKWNWGDFAGTDVSNAGFKSVRVWAKADPRYGVLPKVEFKSGGNINPDFATKHPSTYLVSTGVKSLTEEWQEFCMDVSHVKADALRDVVSPLTVVVGALYNPDQKLGLFIDAAHFSKRKCGD